MKILTIILGLLYLTLLFYLISIKKQIGNVANELKANRQASYNKQIRVQLFDRDLTELVKECNYNLDYQTDLKRRATHQEQTTRQSISDIAHDLRTPLTVVKGNLQLIKNEPMLTEKGQQYVQICQAKTEDLKYMIEDFFELSILESEDSTPELTAVNITTLLLNIILEHEILIREHNLTPVIDLPEKTLFVQGNIQFLERVFGNLFGNIFKYAKDQFSVSLLEETDYCIVKFSNPVSNVKDIDVIHLFDRTYKADTSRHKTGTGLGLYIVKLLAEKQGASVLGDIEKNQLVISLHLKKCTDIKP